MKKLLILGGGIFQVPFVKRAKEMNVYVGLVDINKQAPAAQFADTFFNVSILNIEAIREILRQFKPDGITVGTCETGMRTAATIAREFGLPFLAEDVVDRATNKVLMLEAFKKFSVPSPKYIVVRPGMEVKWKNSFPVITKPADKSASRGIYFVENESQLEDAVNISMSASDTKEVLVEEYLDGPEVSVELVMIESKPKVLQITDKITSGSPYYIELGQSQPSALSKTEIMALEECASKAAVSVGLNNCAVHAEVKMTSKGPRMVELAGRMGGHFIDSYLLEISTGYDLQGAVIRYALGEPMTINAGDARKKCAAMRCIVSKPGVVKSISGVEEAKLITGVERVYITAEIGQRFSEGRSNNDLIGHVVVSGDSTSQALKICQGAIDSINIQFEQN